MVNTGDVLRSIFSRKASLATIALLAFALTGTSHATLTETVKGYVESNGAGLRNYQVSLYAANGSDWQLLGTATTGSNGRFVIAYSVPATQAGQPEPPLFIEAVSGQAMLASAISSVSNVPPLGLVVNERTTVATGSAFAQFISSSSILGNPYGMSNAVHMAANLANPNTGNVGTILALTPNGTETTTLATFNSLANAVASCVTSASNCTKLFEAATPSGGSAPANVLQAIANIAKNPSFLQSDGTPAADDPLFDLSQQREIYSPFLAQRPTGWLLFLKFTGGFYSAQDNTNLMSGPGNFAIDAYGNAWILDNYIPEPPSEYACTGRILIEMYPWGQNARRSPFRGGGLSGAGYGISFDPLGNLWIGNFGFQDDPCETLPISAQHNSLSLFRPNGTPISPAAGYTNGNISWPQGTVSDLLGNIFVANCGNDSITEIPLGDPQKAFNIPLGPKPGASGPQVKPFGIALDLEGNAWVTDNFNDTVSIISPEGTLLRTQPSTYMGKTVLTHPVGNAADSKGNIWVSNSDWLDVPCPNATNPGMADNPSITLYDMNTRTPVSGAPFTGGGLTVPWGIAVDGNDTVWAFNFGSVPADPKACAQTGTNQFACPPTGISHFCGTNTSACPAGLQYVGAPISPKNTGYQSNSLVRITGGQIDPSGNIWLTGNWKIDASPDKNPGGNSIVIVVGAAAPLQTPLIGPPVPF